MKKISYKIKCSSRNCARAIEQKIEGMMFEKNIVNKDFYFGIDHRSKSCWKVTELSTGLAVGEGWNRETCLNNFEDNMRKIGDKFSELVDKHIDRLGICNWTVTTVSKNPKVITIIKGN